VVENYQVKLTKRAQKELDAILVYYLSNYGENAAQRCYRLLNEKLEGLKNMPTANPPYRPINRSFKREYRFVTTKNNYKILYRIVVERDTVSVVTIRHKKSDPGQLIQVVEEE